ncbi:zinc finger protein 493-like [Melanaphis sacchari]|uniref:zinc finger protein 493-like n=1 Tax=Melanaphis sacchari TaxID=742174 RepID=UPI000DC14A30|nr:zinc finger protein 493-like [Melanaphis sacchari]
MSQIHLNNENIDLCRICLMEPESNRNIEFVNIFTSSIGDLTLRQKYEELLGIEIGSNDVKPKIICNNCYKSLSSWDKMKRKAAESETIINYIAVKKFGATNSESNNKLLDHTQPTRPQINEIEKNYILTSRQKIFTCLKPSCNLIFQSFKVFRKHYREHFKLQNGLVCWKCRKIFKDKGKIRRHQSKVKNCHTSDMYKCSKCPDKFDDMQSLSIHKFTFHDGVLVADFDS